MRRYFALLFLLVFMLTVPVLLVAAPLTCGRIVDEHTGQPITNAVVTCGERVAHTDDNGHFSIAAEREDMRVRAIGYRRQTAAVAGGHEISLEPLQPKALYLSFFGVAEPVLRDPALDLLENTELNALVIDAKGDRGMIPYPSSLPVPHATGAQKIITWRHAAEALQRYRDAGIYTIARIVTFKDNVLAAARPDLAIKTETGEVWRDGEGLAWVDPFSQDVWDYNIGIAVEAARMGFDEIQFDYVRFPEKSGLQFSRENNQENRVAAITGFLAEAHRQLQHYNVFMAADIFGYVCWNASDTNIGQQLEALTRHLDYLSPMLYPSGFTYGVGRYRNPVSHPYEIVKLSLDRARERTGRNALGFRPWLQAFRDYAFDRRHFGAEEVRAQTLAAEDFGSNGWMLWNPRNVYSAAGLKPECRVEARADLVEPSTIIQ